MSFYRKKRKSKEDDFIDDEDSEEEFFSEEEMSARNKKAGSKKSRTDVRKAKKSDPERSVDVKKEIVSPERGTDVKEKKIDPGRVTDVKKVKKIDPEKGITACRVSKDRKVVVRQFKNMLLIDIRVYYNKDGEELPSKKGISLKLDEWKILCQHVGKIDEAIREMS